MHSSGDDSSTDATVKVGPDSAPTETPQGDTFWSGETQEVERPFRLLPARYENINVIGVGGMGEVRRVRDTRLNRVVAMKILNNPYSVAAQSRFLSEAQATAQLEHPGIIPIYDTGRLQNGGLYYTMKIAQGVTLRKRIREAHRSMKRSFDAGKWDLSLRKLVGSYLTICEAMAYAHSRGVVHRDLKPLNIMTGDYRETVVVDWGLAKILDVPEEITEIVETERTANGSLATRSGTVTGTPAYMPPEQATGAIHLLGPTADVYSLGAILYEILAGKAPYEHTDPVDTLASVLHGPPDPVAEITELPLPAALVSLCEWAMARDATDRPQNAEELANAVASWIDGAQKRDQARQTIKKTDRMQSSIDGMRKHADDLDQQASALLATVRPHDPVSRRLPGWALQDEATGLRRQASHREVRRLQSLRHALSLVPDLAEAHDRLAAYYRTRHQEAEAARDEDAAAEIELLLGAHDTGKHTSYLAGNATITLHTEPADANVALYRYVKQERRLVAVFERSLDQAPLEGVQLPMGSYVLILRAPDRPAVQYPVYLRREEHWDGIAPDETEPTPIVLPAAGDLGPDDIYVPAGYFWSGGDPEAIASLPRRRLWCHGFVMRRFPVTNREYIEFLDDLVDQGREDEALQHVPRERGGGEGEQGAVIYGRDDNGHFELRPDFDGDLWLEDYPVLMVNWAGARAYAEWLAERTGQPWRLPLELEWEKAGRGADGRIYPWGDFMDATWCCMRDSRAGNQLEPAVVDSFPVDTSPYGVRGLAGNCHSWCLDPFHADGPPIADGRVPLPQPVTEIPKLVVLRGGHWNVGPRLARLATRLRVSVSHRDAVLTVHLVRSFEP